MFTMAPRVAPRAGSVALACLSSWVFMAAETWLVTRKVPWTLTSIRCLKSTKLASAIGSNVPPGICQFDGSVMKATNARANSVDTTISRGTSFTYTCRVNCVVNAPQVLNGMGNSALHRLFDAHIHLDSFSAEVRMRGGRLCQRSRLLCISEVDVCHNHAASTFFGKGHAACPADSTS